MTTDERRAIEREIRRQIVAVADLPTQDALFSLLGLLHSIAEQVEQRP